MTWFKVDDGFWSHPKVLTMSAEATSLWVRAGAYSCQHLTDGYIASGLLPVLGSEDAARELVGNGLWLEADGGFEFHDWDDYQETSDAVKRRRELARERQRRAREGREKSKDVTASVTRDTQRDGGRDSRGSSREVSTPDPTRPDPTTSPNGEVETHARPSGPSVSRFDEFWSTYPRKVGKPKARAKYQAAVKRAGGEQAVIDGARRLASDPNLPEAQFIPHPTTWLERDGWNDEPLPSRRGGPSESSTRSWLDIARGPEQPLDYVDGQVIEFGALG